MQQPLVRQPALERPLLLIEFIFHGLPVRHPAVADRADAPWRRAGEANTALAAEPPSTQAAAAFAVDAALARMAHVTDAAGLFQIEQMAQAAAAPLSPLPFGQAQVAGPVILH